MELERDEPVPAAIDAMVALWSAAPELVYEVDGQPARLRVEDGPPLDDVDQAQVLFVGTGSQYVLGGAQEQRGYGFGGRRTDRAEISCQLQVWSGDTDLAAVRRDAYRVLRTLSRLLLADRTLGGVVDWARIVRSSYVPDQTEQGCIAVLDLTVQIEATRFEEGV